MGVVLVSDVRLVREMLIKLLSSASIEISACCNGMDDLVLTEPSDVVLLHQRAPCGQVLQDVRALRSRAPQAHVILIVPAERHDELRATLEDVSAILSDDSSADTLVGAVRVVQAGFAVMAPQHRAPSEIVLPPNASGTGAGRMRGRSGLMSLSPQESRVLSKLVRGGSNKDIANELGICETTVKVHLRACYEKIGAKNRTQAAMWAAAHLHQPS